MSTQKKIALITGANKGLGLEIARQLGKQNHTVLIASRDLKKAEEAANLLRAESLDVKAIELDVTKPEQIKAAVAQVEKDFGKLDVLINNAGIFVDSGNASSVEQMRETFETNVFAPYAVTEAFLPLLDKSDAPRIVQHSSVLGSLATLSANDTMASMTGPAYSASKSALNMLTVLLAKRLADKPKFKVNAAHPGWVKTDLGGPGAPLEVDVGAQTAVQLATLGADGATGGYFHLGQTLAW